MSRRLTESERKLWLKVARTVRRAPGASIPEAKEEDGASTATSKPKTPIPGRVVKHRTQSIAKSKPKPHVQPTPPPADLSAQRRIRRGQTPVDARLDLHGYTQDGAYHELVAFIHRENAHGARCLLIITGKGKGGGGILKKRFLDWIESVDIRPLISGYSVSHIKHGGQGAYYLFLKSKTSVR